MKTDKLGNSFKELLTCKAGRGHLSGGVAGDQREALTSANLGHMRFDTKNTLKCVNNNYYFWQALWQPGLIKGSLVFSEPFLLSRGSWPLTLFILY